MARVYLITSTKLYITNLKNEKMNFENVNWHYFPLKLWSVKKRIKSSFDLYKGKPKGQIILTLWKKLEKHQKDAQKIGINQAIIVGADSDVLGERVIFFNNGITPLKVDSFSITAELFKKISEGQYPNLVFLFVTNKPNRIAERIPNTWLSKMPVNVFWGVSGKSTSDIASKLASFPIGIENRFIFIKPDYINVDLELLLAPTPQIKLVIQGCEFESRNQVVVLDAHKKIKMVAEKSKITHHFKYDYLFDESNE